jgi:CMP-N,N'-diacetyllegionaminic acid synthase
MNTLRFSMYKKHKFLAVIPARSGSKGLPGKNIKLLGNKPLIGWTISEALQSKYIDRIIVSTDSENIVQVASQYGDFVPFLRPKSLALDSTSMFDTVNHVLSNVYDDEYKYVIILQPTSPLRTSDDIDQAVKMMLDAEAQGCISVTLTPKSPYWMYSIDEKNVLAPIINQDKAAECRQQLPKSYLLNGAIYIAETKQLLKTKNFLTEKTLAYIMPGSRSIDIDTLEDFQKAEVLLQNREGI